MKKYNVVFATDENYIQHVAIAIKSLLENNSNIFLTIYYIIDDVSEINKNRLFSIVAKYNCKFEFVIIDGDKFKSMITNHHFTRGVYFRLMMAELLNEEKVLYLDGDIIIAGSVKHLFEIDIDNSFLAAVLNPGFHWHDDLLMNPKSNYFNAGVLLVNLTKWRSFGIMEKSLEYMDLNKSNIQFADQDVLNAIIDGNWIQIEPKFNQQAVIFDKDFDHNYNCFSENEIKEAKEKPVIIHYSGSSKPWYISNKHPYKKIYWKYLMMTPFFLPYIFKYFTLDNFLKLFSKKGYITN
jgi:lipopolysaccharide biosynthesis glycosyltransferase